MHVLVAIAKSQQRRVVLVLGTSRSMKELRKVYGTQIGGLSSVFDQRGSALHDAGIIHAVIHTETVPEFVTRCLADAPDP